MTIKRGRTSYIVTANYIFWGRLITEMINETCISSTFTYSLISGFMKENNQVRLNQWFNQKITSQSCEWRFIVKSKPLKLKVFMWTINFPWSENIASHIPIVMLPQLVHNQKKNFFLLLPIDIRLIASDSFAYAPHSFNMFWLEM